MIVFILLVLVEEHGLKHGIYYHVKKIKAIKTTTTGSTGNIALNISYANNIVKTIICDGYLAIPFVSCGMWFVKIIKSSDMNVAASTEETIEYVYHVNYL